MKRRGTTTQRAVVTGDSEHGKGNDNESGCSMAAIQVLTGRIGKRTLILLAGDIRRARKPSDLLRSGRQDFLSAVRRW
jgi:hypothetical protein